MSNISKLDFSGQHIYVGMDVHRKSWSICILTHQFEHKTFTQPPDPLVLVNYLHRNFPGATYHAVYEAGYSGFWIHDQLREKGIECIVVNPADVPTKDKERAGKRDKVDCRKLARSLRNGELEGIYVPTRIKIEDRSLLRTRRSMVKKQTRCKNQIKSMLAFYGIHLPTDIVHHNWSSKFIKWLEEIRMEKASGNVAFKVHLDELRYVRGIIVELNRNVRALSRTDEYRVNAQLLKKVTGISTLTAMTFLTELYNIERFGSLDKLASYVGLIPNTDSSGEKDTTTGITNRRNQTLRHLIIESSWIAVRKDPALLMAFEHLCKKMPKTRAIVPIARKLLNRIRYVLKNQKEYVHAVIQ
ncbi:MAG: IS110 family transposase [Syntrophobacteraceae bacterium]|jgi:transposase